MTLWLSPLGADPIVRLAFFIGLLLLAVTAWLWIHVAVLQFLRPRRERLNQASRERWRPLMARALIEPLPPGLPRIRRSERMALLVLWNRLQESIRGESAESLNHFARLAGLDKLALRLLNSPRIKWRLLAIRTLGHLRERQAWPRLEVQLRGRQPVSLLAARALMQIDPESALPILIPMLSKRDDWPVAGAGSLLQGDNNKTLVCKHLTEALRQAPAEHLPRLLRYVRSVNCPDMTATLGKLLDEHDDAEILVPCLRASNHPAARVRVLDYLDHPTWAVRMQAVSTLGRIAEPGDEQRLQQRLGDPSWWVRYRAAEALVALPFLPRPMLEQLACEHSDRYARDMLARALAHAELA